MRCVPLMATLSQRRLPAAPANPQLVSQRRIPEIIRRGQHGFALWPGDPIGLQQLGRCPRRKARNVATGCRAPIGKISPSGIMILTLPDGVLAGFAVPLPAHFGRQALSVSPVDCDVHLYVYVDKDAFSQDMRLWVPGGGVSFEGKTSSGTPLKLSVWRFDLDQAGGGAGLSFACKSAPISAGMPAG